jgi:hypothetical protein
MKLGMYALLSLHLLASPGTTQEERAPLNSPEITPQTRSAIEKGLRWLHRNQSRSGAYGNGSANVATTAIAGMAFLAGGHLPGRSIYGENVLAAVRYLLKMTNRQGYINEGGSMGGRGSGMHGHGYATLFLAEVYGMCSGREGFREDHLEEELKDKLTAAIQIIENAQSANGGWLYTPTRSGDEGSVTITQVQALRAARNAGIRVSIKTIQKALEYVNKSTNSSGMTRYSLTSGGRTSFALTAAGMSCMNFLGQYENPKISKGLDFILKNLPGKRGHSGSWLFYGWYYATLATYQASEAKYWKAWYPAIRSELIRRQASDGSWTGSESASYGSAFGTGFSLQILQIPNRYLPIYQSSRD